MGKRKPPPPLPEPLPGLVDAHTHLDSCGARTPEAVREIVDRAASVGVARIVTVACDIGEARFVIDAAGWDTRVSAAVALHPTSAHELEADGVAEELESLAADPRCVAIGETGLDWYWLGKRDDVATPEQQHTSFGWHIDLAKRLGKPLMIHNRDADADVLADLDRFGAPEVVIFHCFSGDASMARECVDRGYVLSFSGTVTFNNATDLQEAARLVPDEQLLVETDAPFLTPHPYRGTPNESYCVPYTARFLADLRGMTPEHLASATTENARRVYGVTS
ncbi:TatD family hydrolase [Tsukamurella sp. 8F]|uniref:TatD family hydrolase n=1 Tax=unclassified Tsukamurella TaxID=2633480 RepID=UPI0023B8B51D|nr:MULTISPECIES: TatD family hydrolase [unclassified Tsukamurella]MDF0530264.1 TatD family hydrolase [Tsukamurella sp. 8J]MDF0588582.1 TatD family hydrolase [Tsukamurella sp. 8F]